MKEKEGGQIAALKVIRRNGYLGFFQANLKNVKQVIQLTNKLVAGMNRCSEIDGKARRIWCLDHADALNMTMPRLQ